MALDESADTSSAGLHPFGYQVGGHKGMQVIGEGALIVKAALPLELQFYQNILASPTLSSLRPWVPTYLGTLRLEGQNTAEGVASVEGITETEKDECSYRCFTFLKTSRTDESVMNTYDSPRKCRGGIPKAKHPRRKARYDTLRRRDTTGKKGADGEESKKHHLWGSGNSSDGLPGIADFRFYYWP